MIRLKKLLKYVGYVGKMPRRDRMPGLGKINNPGGLVEAWAQAMAVDFSCLRLYLYIVEL